MKIKYSSLLILALFCLPLGHAQNSLNVEVVDDREDADTSPAYIALLGKPYMNGNTIQYPVSVNPGSGSLAVLDLTTNITAAPTLVTSLQASPSSPIISKYTGKSRKVYCFTVNSISSGNFYAFKNYSTNGPPFTFTTNSSGALMMPSPTTSNFRYDMCELSFLPNLPSVADLTTIDQFGMPMQLETFKGPPTALTKVDKRTYYASTRTMLEEIQNLGSPMAMTNAVYKLNGKPGTGNPLPGWNFAADGMKNFVRVMGPGILSSMHKGSTAPYPSFSSYLGNLASSGDQFTVHGTSCGYLYNYTGQVKSVKHGYAIVLNGTLTGTPTMSAGTTVTMHLPTVNQAMATASVSGGQVTGLTTNNLGYGYMGNPPVVTISGPPSGTTATATATVNSDGEVTGYTMTSGGSGYKSASPPTVTVNPPAGSMDTFLYGCTLSSDAIAVSGWTNAQVDATSNTAFSTIVGDASAGINFGYLSGKYPNTGVSWYTMHIPTCIPFGGARNSPDDGFYSPWSAWVYNHSDAYGFAFGDRNGRPEVTINIAPNSQTYNTTLRITLLPDLRLDAPQNVKATASENSLTVTWNPVARYPWMPTVNGGLLTVLSPKGIPPAKVMQNPFTLTGLKPGTPYTFTMAFTGIANGNPVTSPAIPVQATTSGDLVPYQPTGDNKMTFDFGFAGWSINPLNPTWGNGGAGSTMTVNGQKLYYVPATSNWLTSTVLNQGKNATLWAQGGTNQYVVNVMDPSGTTQYSSILTTVFATNQMATATANVSSTGFINQYGATNQPGCISNLTFNCTGTGYSKGCPPVITFPGASGAGANVNGKVSTAGKLTGCLWQTNALGAYGGGGYSAPVPVAISSTYAVKSANLYDSNGPITPNTLPAGTTYYGSTNLLANYLVLPVSFAPTAAKACYPITVAPLGGPKGGLKSSRGWAQPKGVWLPSDMGSWFSPGEDK